MGDPVPFLGSKISLISKSEIRYEGILYTIDPKESIIVLTKVQSFGTEERPTEAPVPAKGDIYEYIIFRGTDIKKIEVCEAPRPQQLSGVHNDPAIVGLQVQQQHSGHPVATSYHGTAYSHQPPLGPIGSVGGNYYGNYGQQSLPTTSGFSIGVSQPSELSSGMGTSVGGVSVETHSPAGSSQPVPVPAPIGAPAQSGTTTHHQDVLAGSRSSTPGPSRKSPVADAGVQVTPPPPVPAPQQQADRKRPNPQNNQRSQLTPERQQREMQGNQSRRGQYIQGQNYQQGMRHNQGYQGYYQGQQQQQQYQNQYRGGGGGNNSGMGRGRPLRRTNQPRGRGVFNQGNRPQRQVFDKEFDFEQANVEFEELMTQLAKTKISENGVKKDEKNEDSGHENATIGDESEDSSSSVYYDKTKSFFDKISCEALERSKGKSQRSDWRQERKINVQTFGVATARRGYYPRGRGGYYNRGGYYRNYNQGYYRGQNNSAYRGSRGGGSGSNGLNPNRTNSSNYNGNVGGTGGGAAPSNSGNTSYASAVRTPAAVPAK